MRNGKVSTMQFVFWIQLTALLSAYHLQTVTTVMRFWTETWFTLHGVWHWNEQRKTNLNAG